jgi:putative transcription factor
MDPNYQDFTPVILRKSASYQKQSALDPRRVLANRTGDNSDNVVAIKKAGAGANSHLQQQAPSNVKKLDEHGETFKQNILAFDLRQELQKARVQKGWTQAQLAQKISEPVTVVQNYENGKAVPKPQILNKLNRLLGTHLKVTKPKSIENNSKE